jgi:hypothetical protein
MRQIFQILDVCSAALRRERSAVNQYFEKVMQSDDGSGRLPAGLQRRCWAVVAVLAVWCLNRHANADCAAEMAGRDLSEPMKRGRQMALAVETTSNCNFGD